MATLLIFEFQSSGPWGEEMANSFKELAFDIANEPGLKWKVWTEAPDRGVAGGVYLFEDANYAQAYNEKHAARLKDYGIGEIEARSFEVNEALSTTTRGL